jgi:hypothetical protein
VDAAFARLVAEGPGILWTGRAGGDTIGSLVLLVAYFRNLTGHILG